jgi:transposase
MTSEILTGPERRRRWSAVEKAGIVAEAKAPGATVSDVARRHGISRGLLYTWCRSLGGVAPLDLVPVVVETVGGSTPREAGGSIEIALAAGVRVTVRGRVDPKGLRAVLAALRSA